MMVRKLPKGDERSDYRVGFGKRLDLLREQAGYSKKELAEKAGMALNTVCQYTLGQVEPTVYSLYKLCQALGCTADELVDPDFYEIGSQNLPWQATYVSDDLAVQLRSTDGKMPALILFADNGALAVSGNTSFDKMKRL